MADTSLSEKKIGLLIWQVSNYWQTNLRKILKDYNLTLNEYLILESIKRLQQNKNEIVQNEISIYAGIDISVASVTFKLLESKKLIVRIIKKDNRKKIIEMLVSGNNLYNKISPLVLEKEKNIFDKLQNESNNFTNSLKLILGRSLRIKANKIL
jgi:DNA-binding MarR family transcriptional regulator